MRNPQILKANRRFLSLLLVISVFFWYNYPMNSLEIDQKITFFLEKMLFFPENLVSKVRQSSPQVKEKILPIFRKISECQDLLLEATAEKIPEIFITAGHNVTKKRIKTLHSQESQSVSSEMKDLNALLSDL